MMSIKLLMLRRHLSVNWQPAIQKMEKNLVSRLSELLVTQMSHQDPMDPMNTDSMMQQMASLGTVEQLQNLNAKTDSLGLSKQLMRSALLAFR